MRPNSHLNISERTVISNMYRQNKYTQAEIARAINRDPSVISRELRRNGNASGYDPDMAQKNYHLRKLKTVYQKQFNEKIFDYFKDGLKNKISPDVIAGILKTSVDKTCHVSTQTIYNWIYKERFGAGLTKFLLFGNHRYKKSAAKQKGALITLIDRKSLYIFADVLENKMAETFSEAIRNLFADLDADRLKTLLFDNGCEMSMW